ncbi:hypothetical protein EWJ82_24615, partial [Salmonella enterica subsp. enterica serovar Weybridge]|nr:hypothetical protein [Salmonella enterica subsp. enterica serovar Weybridge]
AATMAVCIRNEGFPLSRERKVNAGRSRFTGFPYTPAALPPGCMERRPRRDRGRRDRNGRSKPAVDVATAWDGNPLPRRGRAETATLALCEA